MNFKKIILLVSLLFLSACGSIAPGTINYDASKNNQRQYDSDLSNCQLLAFQRYGSNMDIPGNYFEICMRAKGWHK